MLYWHVVLFFMCSHKFRKITTGKKYLIIIVTLVFHTFSACYSLFLSRKSLVFVQLIPQSLTPWCHSYRELEYSSKIAFLHSR